MIFLRNRNIGIYGFVLHFGCNFPPAALRLPTVVKIKPFGLNTIFFQPVICINTILYQSFCTFTQRTDKPCVRQSWTTFKRAEKNHKFCACSPSYCVLLQ